MFDQRPAVSLGSKSVLRRRRLLIVHNPQSGLWNGRRLDKVLSCLSTARATLDVRTTTCPGEASRIAAAATAERFDAVVVAGGDGTINEVVNGLTHPDLPVAVLPLGTANVLAAELALPTGPEAIARVILDGPPRRIHLGRANDRLFILMAGIGFDAHVVAGVDPAIKHSTGKLAYWLTVLRTLRRFPYPAYRIEIDGRAYTAASLVVANAHYYGGRYTCAPTASVFAPELIACLLLRPGVAASVSYALALLRGNLADRDDVMLIAARHIRIEATDAPEPVQCDGDVVGHLPVTIEAAATQVSILVPPDVLPAGR